MTSRLKILLGKMKLTTATGLVLHFVNQPVPAEIHRRADGSSEWQYVATTARYVDGQELMEQLVLAMGNR
jgi:hypothetical protein